MSEIDQTWIVALRETARALAGVVAQLQRYLSREESVEDRGLILQRVWRLTREQVALEDALDVIVFRQELWLPPDRATLDELREVTRTASTLRDVSPQECVLVADRLLHRVHSAIQVGYDLARVAELVKVNVHELHADVRRLLADDIVAPLRTRPEVRRIQARVRPLWIHGTAQKRGNILRRALRAQGLHEIEVRIGVADDAWPSLAKPFPEERLPPADAHQLTVIFIEPRLAPEPQVATITLPARGNSDVARFHLFARGHVDGMLARITVLHANRVLQTALLAGPIVSDPEHAPKGTNITLEPETSVSLDLDDLDGRTPFDVALVFNHAGGEPQVTAIAGELASLISLGNVSDFVQGISDHLSTIAAKPEEHVSFDQESTHLMFRRLASRGNLLHRAIERGVTAQAMLDVLRRARRVQVLTAKDGAVLPVELAYAFKAPEEGAKLCMDGVRTLAAGVAMNLGDVRCPAGCEAGDGHLVCPLGFWGLSRVIERQAYSSRDVAREGADFGIRVNARPGEHLDVLRRSLFAASARVDEEQKDSSAAVVEALRAVTRGPVHQASTWEEWRTGIRSCPSLLVLLVHKVKSADLDVQTIQIGAEQSLPIGRVDQGHVRADSEVRPLVLLIGCNTSFSDSDLQQFPVYLQDSGAAIVVGTVASVLGRHAGPVTAQMLLTMADLTARGGVPFGDALLATKRKLVGEGLLMAMCLCAHGDAGWILAGAPETTR